MRKLRNVAIERIAHPCSIAEETDERVGQVVLVMSSIIDHHSLIGIIVVAVSSRRPSHEQTLRPQAGTGPT